MEEKESTSILKTVYEKRFCIFLILCSKIKVSCLVPNYSPLLIMEQGNISLFFRLRKIGEKNYFLEEISKKHKSVCFVLNLIE